MHARRGILAALLAWVSHANPALAERVAVVPVVMGPIPFSSNATSPSANSSHATPHGVGPDGVGMSLDHGGSEDEISLRAAAALRAALHAQGVSVLDEETARRAMNEHVARGGQELGTYEERLAQAEQALGALQPERSVELLESLTADLAQDADFTLDKQRLLESARLKLASRLIGLAGSKETGKAETPSGARAKAALVDALRANPKLTPSREEYPPRFHVVLEQARVELNRLGTGGLRVDSRPTGATVFIEGRNLGQTPLALGDDVLARGAYRMWVELDGVRSVPQVVRVDARTTVVFVDLALDGALWAAGPGLRPVPGGVLDEDVLRKVAGLLGVQRMVLVGRWRDDEGDFLWTTSLAVADGTRVRTGAVVLDPQGRHDDALASLATFAAGGDARGIREKALPPSVLPPRTSGGAEKFPALGAAEGEVPWGTVALIAAGAGVLLAAGGAAVAVAMLAPKDGAAILVVKELK